MRKVSRSSESGDDKHWSCLKTFVIKWFLIITTAICVLGGIVVVCGAVWIMVDETAADDFESQQKLQGIRTGAAILLIGGLLIIIINITGCVGALFNKPKPLLAFIILVAIFLVIPEVILILWFAAQSGQVVELTDSVLKRNLKGFMVQNDTNSRIFMINIQTTLECCAFQGISDYRNKQQRDTCLIDKYEKSYYIEGCKSSLAKMFKENLMIVGIVEIFHLVISILAMIAAGRLRKRILSDGLTMEGAPVVATEGVHLTELSRPPPTAPLY